MVGTAVSFVVPVVLLVLGAGLLAWGAASFADHVTVASAHLGVRAFAVGVLLAAAVPEVVFTAMLASGRGHPALAAGDAVGANLVLLTLALGLAATLTRMPVSRRVGEYAVGAAVAGAVAALLLHNGVLDRSEGALLVLLYVGAVSWVWWREQQPPAVGRSAAAADPPAGTTDRQTSRALRSVLAGVLALVVGGYLAVRGADGLVRDLDLRESVGGLTLLALATSAETVAVVWAARRRGLTEMAVAAMVGAVVYNATAALGLAALVNPLILGRHNPVFTAAAGTAVLPLVLLAGRRTGSLPRAVGVLLVAAYVVAVGWLFTA